MTSPYATVIIPTHNRPHTLPASVRSAQSQTVRDIEILIVGDGVDPTTREIAGGLAAEDPRIIFMDNAKGERSGVVHRHNAVLGARSDRIFYNDDDDLLLPEHVETLGPRLDHAQVAESLPASVSLSGRIEVSLANHGWAAVRRELAGGRLKITYDTHVAHTRQAYLSLDAPWLSRSGDIAGSFLARFAASSEITWTSVARVTALSLHGAARKRLSAAQRAAELAAFEKRITALSPSQFGHVWYLQYVHMMRSPLWDQHSSTSTLRNLGFVTGGETVDDPLLLSLDLTPEQSLGIAALFKFNQGIPLAAASVAKLMLELSEPLQGGQPFCAEIARRAAASVGVSKAASALRAIPIRNPYDAELAHYLLFFLLKQEGKTQEAKAVLNRLDGRRCIHADYKTLVLQQS